jgi:PilZ domain-containing protein
MNRRRVERLQLNLACRVYRDSQQVIAGTTMDINRLGALIRLEDKLETALMPTVGDAMRIEVLLTQTSAFDKGFLICDSVAVRVEQEPQGCKLAVQFEQVDFHAMNAQVAASAVM